MSLFKKNIFKSGSSWVSIFTSTLVISFSFLIISLLALFSQNLGQALNTFGENIQASVYLKPNVTEEDKQALIQQINSSFGIKKAEWISPEKAIQSLSNQLDGLSMDVAKDPELMASIPTSIEVTFQSEKFTPNSLKDFSKDIEKNQNVEEVTFGQEWLESYSKIVSGFEKIGWVLVLFLLSSCFLVVSRSVQASVLQRRSQIEVLELVGATRSFIRKPFIREGLLIGFLSSVLSLSLCYMVYRLVYQILVQQKILVNIGQNLNFIRPSMLISFIALGSLFCAWVSWWSVKKVNSGWSASQGAAIDK